MLGFGINNVLIACRSNNDKYCIVQFFERSSSMGGQSAW